MNKPLELLRTLATMGIVLVSATLSSCASTHGMGARDGFDQRALKRLYVAPFYQRTTFGGDEESVARNIERYQTAATSWLGQQGYEIIGPRAFQQALVEAGAWEIYEEGVLLRDPLDELFERAGRSVDAATIAQLAKMGVWEPSATIVFGEIVYQAEATCEPRSEEQGDAQVTYRALVVTKQAPGVVEGAGAAPCFVSHFQSKLVDAQSAATIWYNRRLIEYRVEAWSEEDRARAIAAAVDAVYGAEDAGLH